MLCMFGAAVWVRELDHIHGDAEEIGGHGDVVPQENAENTMDSETNKPGSDGNGGYHQEADYNDKAAATGVSGPCVMK